MSTYPVGAINGIERAELLKGHLVAVGVGEIRWRYERSKIFGSLKVETGIARNPEGILQFRAVEYAPDEPSMQYIVAGAPYLRLDVNGKHKQEPRQTHLHRLLPEGEEEFVPDAIGISLRHGTNPVENDYKQIWEAFARVAFIDLPPDYWTEMPKEWRP